MPDPYEPVLRHEPTPGKARCAPCTYGLLNHPCGEVACWCSCNAPNILHIPEDWGDRDAAEPDLNGPVFVADWTADDEPLKWEEPPAKPEDISTWSPAPGKYGFTRTEPLAGIHRKHRMKEFIAKWEVPWAILTVLLYVIAVLMLIFVFPDVSNTWLGVFVLVSGLTASLTALASVLKTKE